jgi:hypothetical protein
MTVAITAMMVSCTSSKPTSANPPAGVNAGTDGKPAPYREPVRLASKDGVLEVRLSAHQGTVNLDTIKFGRLDQRRQPVPGADPAGGSG